MNRNQLKTIAVFAMLIDHIAWAFVPVASPAGQAMHFVGRLTDPIMAFFVAEGYLHTRSIRKYVLRLFLFALISQPPFSLYLSGTWFSLPLNVMFTLLLGLLAIWLWDRGGLPQGLRLLAVLLLCILAIPGDWSFMNVLWPLCFFLFRQDEQKKWLSYLVLALLYIGYCFVQMGPQAAFHFGLLCAPLLLRCCSGEPGSRAPFHKWFFYLFYPCHLLLLWLLKP